MAVQAGVDPLTFYDMTPLEIKTSIVAYTNNIEIKDRHVARICWVVAEVNRNPKKKRTPFKEDDFMPQKKKKEQTPEEMFNVIKVMFGNHAEGGGE